jgi:hypothetical protein
MLTAIAGASTAAAQELVTYSLTWSEVIAGTNQPVSIPNGSLGPGEGVRLAMRVTYSPPFGSPATYTPPPPPGTGTIAGLGSIFVDILGMNLLGGTWSNLTSNAAANPGGVPGGHNWSLGGTGDPQPNGNIINIGAGQFVLPGSTAVSTNPIDNIWRGTWTPSSYTVRTLTFQVAGAVASGGQHSSLLIKYGNEPARETRSTSASSCPACLGAAASPFQPREHSPSLAALSLCIAGLAVLSTSALSEHRRVP